MRAVSISVLDHGSLVGACMVGDEIWVDLSRSLGPSKELSKSVCERHRLGIG